jgi:hypothetical protein
MRQGFVRIAHEGRLRIQVCVCIAGLLNKPLQWKAASSLFIAGSMHAHAASQHDNHDLTARNVEYSSASINNSITSSPGCRGNSPIAGS